MTFKLILQYLIIADLHSSDFYVVGKTSNCFLLVKAYLQDFREPKANIGYGH